MPYKDPEKKRANDENYAAAHREEKCAYNAAYYAAHREEIGAQKTAYHAAHSEQIHTKQAIYRDAHREEARVRVADWRVAHPEEARATSAAYRATHGEQKRVYDVVWRKTHPGKRRAYAANRRARKRGAGGSITVAAWATIKAHYGHRCVYCGKKPRRLTQDHLTPLAHGGRHDISNIVPACHSCNARKGARKVLTPVQPLLLL